MSENKLAGKVALITGGARGLGRGYALHLAGLGADVAIVDRNLRAAEVYEFEKELLKADTVMEECEALGAHVLGIEADLTDREVTEAAVARLVDELGSVDIAICNAGGGTVVFADEVEVPEDGQTDINTTGTASDCPQEMLTRVLDTNLMTCMYTCMAVAPYMKAQKHGKIVTVSSTGGMDAGAGYHPYGTAKAAIIYYTRTLAQDLGPYNITVNAIAPGIIRTGRLGDRAHLSKYIALRREGTIEDCARVVEFLVTDLSDYVTGRTIPIDGGQYR
ncbi:MAG: SDR family NAD(P)-dependent oxidoreductase [Pseudomonadales bacterium]|jgi:3-oxoacyl-[acyl-carrier protein] reductase|nr:SDR family NAD(P)-dependent oxidoreductase [Pseudomonadales bacterium]MDP6470957.1 SDR family NAD(P)-dependent oxidoreductase [Pseudomonadales bacterium]MDP6825858.1 SDR family NAD(P)-dependent oxidoreductase [Pseudomonadales bacterium]MDP6972826.1 SDR family NAD(P)-dependent oxidoreductase [Pseudomonadales bacterium]